MARPKIERIAENPKRAWGLIDQWRTALAEAWGRPVPWDEVAPWLGTTAGAIRGDRSRQEAPPVTVWDAFKALRNLPEEARERAGALAADVVWYYDPATRRMEPVDLPRAGLAACPNTRSRYDGHRPIFIKAPHNKIFCHPECRQDFWHQAHQLLVALVVKWNYWQATRQPWG